MPASEFAGKWAVCPPVQIPEAWEPQEEPQIFETEADAQAFLDSSPPAPVTDEDQAEAQPSQVRYRSLGWRKVPVRGASESRGSRCTQSFEDYLKGKEEAPAADGLLEMQIHSALDDVPTSFQVYLGKDWCFERDLSEATKQDLKGVLSQPTISNDAARRGGNGFLHRGPMIEALLRVVIDLEQSLRKFHPGVTAGAVADFFQSWQVQRYLADVCGRIERLRWRREGMLEAASEAAVAQVYCLYLLARYAAELRLEGESVVDGAREKATARPAPEPVLPANAEIVVQWNIWPVPDAERAAIQRRRREVLAEYKRQKGIERDKEFYTRAGYSDRSTLYAWLRGRGTKRSHERFTGVLTSHTG